MASVVGVVGSEAKKFTPRGEESCRIWIAKQLESASACVSGRSPLGGVDIWAEEEAAKRGIKMVVFEAQTNRWDPEDGSYGFKARNMDIALYAGEVHCFTVDQLPNTYSGRRFDLCYHCGTDDHVKSGGCWTMKQAVRLGKPGYLHVITNNYA